MITHFSYILFLPDDTCTGSDGDIDTRSLDVHRGSDGPEPDEEQLGRAAQIPDFSLFYNTVDDSIRRRLPLIVEIKPYRFGDPTNICLNMLEPTLLQACHVFECFGYNDRPGYKILHVLCVAGKHFFMYKVDIESLDLLPEVKDEELSRDKLRFLYDLQRRVQIAEVLNANGTDYSIAFNLKGAWTGFTLNCELGILAKRTKGYIKCMVGFTVMVCTLIAGWYKSESTLLEAIIRCHGAFKFIVFLR